MSTFQTVDEGLGALRRLPSIFLPEDRRAKIHTPDRTYPGREDVSVRPSWSLNDGFLNNEHREIFERTIDIPGFHTHDDSYKLYEMAYYSGDTILEVGTYSGKSAVIELMGALANKGRKRPPQYFGIDLDIQAVRRTYDALRKEGLHRLAFLFYGDLAAFSEQFSISPTMVFVDGDHSYEAVKRDLAVLSKIVAPGVPVFCHDYIPPPPPDDKLGEFGVDRAVNEWEEEGFVRFLNCFGRGALLVTTDKCHRPPRRRMARAHFLQRRNKCLKRYCSLNGDRFMAGREFCEFKRLEQLAYIAKKALKLKSIGIEEKEEQIVTLMATKRDQPETEMQEAKSSS